jgi:hypothetical protein
LGTPTGRFDLKHGSRDADTFESLGTRTTDFPQVADPLALAPYPVFDCWCVTCPPEDPPPPDGGEDPPKNRPPPPTAKTVNERKATQRITATRKTLLRRRRLASSNSRSALFLEPSLWEPSRTIPSGSRNSTTTELLWVGPCCPVKVDRPALVFPAQCPRTDLPVA